MVGVIDGWFGGRRVRPLVGRACFRHFGSTSWVAEDVEGGLVGVLIGYRSPDRPTEAVIHLVGVHPNHRRRGIGRALIQPFVPDGGAHGVAVITAAAWPGEPPAAAV